MTTLTPETSPEYLTVKECQEICRFKGPEAIRRAVYRGDLPGVRIRANRLLIPSVAFWKWFHANDVTVKKPTAVEMPAFPIQQPAKEEVA